MNNLPNRLSTHFVHITGKPSVFQIYYYLWNKKFGVKVMEVTAWNNGEHNSTGAGYGFKVNAKDRDKFFQRSWETIFVSLPGENHKVMVNIAKSSFWSNTCRELINQEFGRWLLNNGYAPWPLGTPPRFYLRHESGNHFRLDAKLNTSYCSS